MTALSLRKFIIVSVLAAWAVSAFAQEAMLAYKYAAGQKLRYKVTSTTLREGSMFPGGRVEHVIHLYYTFSVTAVDKEGTATVTFIQDSISYSENSQVIPYDAAEQLNTKPITMWFSNLGMLVDANFPDDLSKEAAAYLDGLINDFNSEPPLPGRARGVGAEWKNDLLVYFILPEGSVRASNAANSQYVRKEQFRGRECARIEYAGKLLMGSQRIGLVSGTIHHSLNDGKILRVSSKTDATLYVTMSGGRAQMRISNTQTREALN
ncbi:MAG: hypothetical protein L0Y80_09075 [Ignavibacteriae bacterium]|nr:hypothetical protein [Ignavibacteriota bacterium]